MPLTESISQKSATVLQTRNDVSSQQAPADSDKKVCWIEVKRCPYQPNHQVELLHLQAEADALLIKLQNASKDASESAGKSTSGQAPTAKS